VATVTLAAEGPRTARPPHEARFRASRGPQTAKQYVTLGGAVVDDVRKVHWTNDPQTVMRTYTQPGEGTMPHLAIDQVVEQVPNWRFLQAEELLTIYQMPEAIPYDRTMDNVLMTHVVPFFYEKKRNAALPELEYEFQKKNESKSRACLIYESASEKRWVLEALLLAGAAPEGIALEINEDINTLYWYSVIFFDVGTVVNRPLKAWMTLLNPLINKTGPKIYEDVVFKLAAWSGGVDAVMDQTRSVMGTTLSEVSTYQQVASKQIYRQATMALMNRRVHGGNENEVIECLAKIKEIVPSDAESESELAGHVRTLMNSVSSSLSMRKAAEFELSGREARAAESMADIWHRIGADTAGEVK